jgi:amino-acid N-acetyltransferase
MTIHVTMTTATSTTSAASTASKPASPAIEVERATDDDAGEIARVLRRNADVPTLILQPPATILRHIDEFVVVRGPDRTVVGCAQLRWHRPRIAEVMAVAVDPSRQGEGLGRVLVRACLERAMQHQPDPELVWLATRTPGFFARLGFRKVPIWQVPPAIILGKLGLVLEQSPRRWLGTMLGGATIMRWTGAW